MGSYGCDSCVCILYLFVSCIMIIQHFHRLRCICLVSETENKIVTRAGDALSISNQQKKLRNSAQLNRILLVN